MNNYNNSNNLNGSMELDDLQLSMKKAPSIPILRESQQPPPLAKPPTPTSFSTPPGTPTKRISSLVGSRVTSFSSNNLERKSTFIQKLFSVRVMLMLTFAIQVVFMAVISYTTTTISIKNTTDDLSGKILENIVLRVEQQVSSNFAPAWLLSKAAADQIADNPILDYANLRPALWKIFQLSQNTSVAAIYMGVASTGDSYGYILTPFNTELELVVNRTINDAHLYPVIDKDFGISNQTDQIYTKLDIVDIRKVFWWNEVINSKKQLWTGIFTVPSISRDFSFFTAAYPFIDSVTGNVTAIFAADMTTTSLLTSLQTIVVSAHSVIWVMDPQGALVGCSNKNERTYTQQFDTITYAQDSNLELVRETTKIILQTNITNPYYDWSYSLGGEDIQAHVSSLSTSGINLLIVVAYPKSDFLYAVTRIQRNILIISCVAFVFSAAIGVLVVYKIATPLARLGRQMTEISNGSFDSSTLRRTGSTALLEIKELQFDFERMVTALRSFGRFVPVDIVKYLLRNNTEAVASVTQKELTVMFSDIKGFTQKVEEMSPAQLSLLLSDYLNSMCAVIADNHGTVDKFIGDAIMALWNVPLSVSNHPIHACETALQSLHCLEELNVKWAMGGLPEVQCRIGLHTGKALVGNLGSKERLAFTAVGDNINLAARLESLNKKYGTSILVSGEIYQAVKHDYLCRYLDIVVVQGRTTPTHLYELVSHHKNASQKQLHDCRAQAEAVTLYMSRQFEPALLILKGLQESLPNDISIKLLIDRCSNNLAHVNSLPEDWTGHHVLDEK